jgi:V/A-type H+-transporting ATPase subunit E
MKVPDKSNTTATSGVEALIGRLRDEGVAEGRNRAEKIVAEAQARAKWLVDQAKEEADKLRQTAHEEAERFRKAGEEALHVAARDTLLTLKTSLTQRFAGEVKRLVATELNKKEILQQLILEIVGRTREEVAGAKQVAVLLPQDVIGLEELREKPDDLQEGELTHFVRAIAQDMVREGVTFGVMADEADGIQVRLVDKEIILDLNDQTIADLLLAHLQPRFRALLEGIVK